MGNIFPKWMNKIPLRVSIIFGFIFVYIIFTIWYVATPKELRVGYKPQQPIPFDHTIHAGKLNMDCRYCHSFVENSQHSNIPAAQVCWNCHAPGKVKSDSPKLELLRQAMDKNYEKYTGKPISWVQIHKVPDYAYFDHSVHVNRGVSCVECHGKVNDMKVVSHSKSLSMGWCLECHRNPEKALRPLNQITNLDWKPKDLNPESFYKYLEGKTGISKEEYKKKDLNKKWSKELIGSHLRKVWKVNPSQDCSACHR